MTTAETIHALATIALKAHHNNPSPIDIKEQLAALPVSILQKIQEQSAEQIANDNKQPNDNPG